MGFARSAGRPSPVIYIYCAPIPANLAFPQGKTFSVSRFGRAGVVSVCTGLGPIYPHHFAKDLLGNLVEAVRPIRAENASVITGRAAVPPALLSLVYLYDFTDTPLPAAELEEIPAAVLWIEARRVRNDRDLARLDQWSAAAVRYRVGKVMAGHGVEYPKRGAAELRDLSECAAHESRSLKSKFELG